MSKWMSDQLKNYLGELAEKPEYQPPYTVTVKMLEYLDNAGSNDVDDLADKLYQEFPELSQRQAGFVVIYWQRVRDGRKGQKMEKELMMILEDIRASEASCRESARIFDRRGGHEHAATENGKAVAYRRCAELIEGVLKKEGEKK